MITVILLNTRQTCLCFIDWSEVVDKGTLYSTLGHRKKLVFMENSVGVDTRCRADCVTTSG